MMHELEVPLSLAGLEVYADQALAKQVVARTFAAVVVGRRRLDGQVDEAQFFVDRDLGPHPRVAVDGP